MAASTAYDHLAKIIVTGESGVGKSNILTRYLREEFSANAKPTIGVTFGQKIFEVDGTRIMFQFWDTAGQERFQAFNQLYYRRAAGALLVYDVSSRASFARADVWLKELRAAADERTVVALVGNKLDLGDGRRQVTTDEGRMMAAAHELLFAETSALDGTNVAAVFEQLYAAIHERIARDDDSDGGDHRQDVITLHPDEAAVDGAPSARRQRRCCGGGARRRIRKKKT